MADPSVLIVGAGPIGLVLALWLTKQGVPVRIVDKAAGPGTTAHRSWWMRDFSRRSSSGSLRTSRRPRRMSSTFRSRRLSYCCVMGTLPDPTYLRAAAGGNTHTSHLPCKQRG
jgi:cation diffusion facilitator CzcD-associated flavoprotein CzcO